MKQLIIVLLLAAGIAWAGSQGTPLIQGLPLFALCAVLIFAIQWGAFVPAYLAQTEVYYDLTGSITYLLVVALALLGTQSMDPRALLLAGCVAIWALRLGSFLFSRIRQDGADSRFDRIKPVPLHFLNAWTLQGLWILVTAGAALAAISSTERQALGGWALAGSVCWLLGFVIELVADRQKRVFRAAQGAGGFITTGLWSRSRHPNYFGEILLWFGVALIAVPALSGWQYLTLISPVFVFLLLTRVSGVPMLEKKADRRWGEDSSYQAYKANTPILVPRLFS